LQLYLKLGHWLLQLVGRGKHDTDGTGVPLGVRVGDSDGNRTAVEMYAEQHATKFAVDCWSLSFRFLLTDK